MLVISTLNQLISSLKGAIFLLLGGEGKKLLNQLSISPRTEPSLAPGINNEESKNKHFLIRQPDTKSILKIKTTFVNLNKSTEKKPAQLFNNESLMNFKLNFYLYKHSLNIHQSMKFCIREYLVRKWVNYNQYFCFEI